MHIVLDIILILIFAVSALIGYLRGFFRSVWKFLALGGAVFLAYTFGGTVGRALFLSLWQKVREGQEVSDLLSEICGFLLIFVTSVLVLSVVGILLKKLVRSQVLSLLDSFLGMVLGFANGLILVFFACMVLSLIIELNLSGEKTEFLVKYADESVIFRLFCQFSPFQYIHIEDLF